MGENVKHTDANWFARGMVVYSKATATLPDGGLLDYDKVIARAVGSEANARLIAAAPELLDLLKGIHSELVRQGINFGPYIADAESLIAKAEGRP